VARVLLSEESIVASAESLIALGVVRKPKSAA
jgi:hypothetical protein